MGNLTSLIMQLQFSGGKFVRTTTMDFVVAKELNMYSNSAFMAALSEHDHAATCISELVEDFCSGLYEEELGKQFFIKINFQNTIEIC